MWSNGIRFLRHFSTGHKAATTGWILQPSLNGQLDATSQHDVVAREIATANNAAKDFACVGATSRD
jgi:hypothetical protein